MKVEQELTINMGKGWVWEECPSNRKGSDGKEAGNGLGYYAEMAAMRGSEQGETLSD